MTINRNGRPVPRTPVLNNAPWLESGDNSSRDEWMREKLAAILGAASAEHINMLMESGGKDATLPVYDYRDFADTPITIKTIRARPSKPEYRDPIFAEAVFRGDGIDAGLIRAGGAPGRYLLKIEPWNLPRTLILRLAGFGQYGELYNWERVQ